MSNFAFSQHNSNLKSRQSNSPASLLIRHSALVHLEAELLISVSIPTNRARLRPTKDVLHSAVLEGTGEELDRNRFSRFWVDVTSRECVQA